MAKPRSAPPSPPASETAWSGYVAPSLDELARLAEAALSLAPGINFYTLTMGERTMMSRS